MDLYERIADLPVTVDGWSLDLVDRLATTDRVRVLDLKGQYRATSVGGPPDPELYRMVLERFPDAIVEDPALTEETRPVLAGHEDRISWDSPITGVGRHHVQALAAVFSPTAPNDVAPRGYNDVRLSAGLPTSPLAIPENPVGLGRQ